MSICLRGEAEFWGAGERVVVREEMVDFISSNEKYGVKVIGTEKDLLLDVFNLLRDDYLCARTPRKNEVGTTFFIG